MTSSGMPVCADASAFSVKPPVGPPSWKRRRLSSSQRGYDAAWRKVRAWVLSQPPSGRRRADGVIVGHGPLCVMSWVLEGRTVPATEVDHIDGNSRNNHPPSPNAPPAMASSIQELDATVQAFYSGHGEQVRHIHHLL